MRIFVVILFLFIYSDSFSQEQTNGIKGAPEDRVRFYKFLIPASINGSDIAPAAITSFNVEFGDDKVDFKYGNSFKKSKTESEKKNKGSDALKHSYFLGFELGAPDGIATLYKYDNSPLEISFKGGITLVAESKFWNFTKHQYKNLIGERSTERFQWFNIIPKIGFANLNVFSNDTTYEKKSTASYSLMGNYNIYFHSRMGSKKIYNGIFSVGAGFGRINNYQNLEEITREKGIVYNTPGYSYYSKKEDEIKGRLGVLEETSAGLYNVEGYKALIRDSIFTWYLGARYYGYVADKENIPNASLGFFFSFSGKDDKGEFAEKFGFAINGSLKNLHEVEDKEGFRENFAITLSASLPLKFNYDRKVESGR